MEETEAYFAKNNPFSTEGTKKYDFTFCYNNSEENINQQLRFVVREDENIHNLRDKIAAGVGKVIKRKKEENKNEDNKEENSEVEVNNDQDNAVFVSTDNIQLFQNGQKLDYNMKFKSFDKLTDNLEFKLFDVTYKILMNIPKIIKLELPNAVFTNFPVSPSVFAFTLLDNKSSEYTWYKSVDKVNWTIIGDKFSYITKNDDLGHFIKFKCTPIFENKKGQPLEVVSAEKIVNFPHVCPFEKRTKSTPSGLTGNTFRIISYNILADNYIKGKFLYCPENARNIDYRKILIWKELKDYNADIICLQETDYRIYKNFFVKEMFKLGYKCSYVPKCGKPEGLSIFFYGRRFSILKKKTIVIGKEIETNPSMSTLWQKIQENENLAKKLLDQNTVFQIVVLKSQHRGDVLIIGNTHLYYHPDAGNIRNLQAAICMKYAENVIQEQRIMNNKISFIFCGDFNSIPSSSVFDLITKGVISDEAEDWTKNPEEFVPNLKLTSSRVLKSAYGKPKFTNYTDDFKECLDYIFFEPKYLKLVNVVPLLTEEEMAENTALPSIVVPSDHLALVADFKLIN